MSWHFLQEQEEASWGGHYLAGAPSALLRLIPTPGVYFLRGSGTESCRDFQSGTTCRHSMASPGAGESMSSLEGFPAKTSAQPAEAKGSPGSEVGSGATWPESWVKFDPVSCSWKTRQFSLLEDLESFSGTWPRWGIMLAGECYPQLTPSGLVEHRAWITSAIGSGSWRAPTPQARDWKSGKASDATASKNARPLNEWVQRVPTPRASNGGPDFAKMERSKTGISLATFDRMPTPTTPTGNASGRLDEWGGSGNPWRGTEEGGGPLNPTWVEWLMGWPIGWTDLQPLEMAKFRQWCDSHGASFLAAKI